MDDIARQATAYLSGQSAAYAADRPVNDLETIRSWFAREPIRPVTYVLYSPVSESDLKANLGLPEYSYFFVREMFRAALAKNSRVIVVTDPAREVDAIFDDCEARGSACVFLSFAPPHRTFVDLRCPTVPVFAWEFDTIPDETWGAEPRNDWRYVLARLGGAITHSQYSVRAVKDGMGACFPVVSIPAPVWDSCQSPAMTFELARHTVILSVEGVIFDNRAEEPRPAAELLPVVEPPRPGFVARLGLTASFALQWYRAVIADLLPATITGSLTRLAAVTYRQLLTDSRARKQSVPPVPASLTIAEDEIVYSCVFNPNDGRKNWQDVVTAFCTALDVRDDATLVLKFVHNDCTPALAELRTLLSKLRPHRCRVVAVAGFLDERQYSRLIGRTSFVVNASLSEGQCLPLMEFMSSGKPAIAPVNTAMEEYIDSLNAFVVESSRELCCWPHDSRLTFRARRYRVNWDSLLSAFEQSYAVARQEPALYAEMAKTANTRLRAFCSEKVVLGRLARFLGIAATDPMPPVHPDSTPDEMTAEDQFGVNDVAARLATASYFHGVPVPKLESDYDAFDPSRGLDARRLLERYGIVTRGAPPLHNRIYVHRNCGRLRYASTFTFNGSGNVVVLGDVSGFHGSLTFEGHANTVVLMGNHGRLALDATLYDRDMLICGSGTFAWGMRVWVHGGTSCTIGDDCLLSENTSIRTSDHHSIIDLNTKSSTNLPADIAIGKHVWIGPNSVIGKGVHIGDGSIVATNSVVNHSIGPAELWGGVPARQIRQQVSWVRSNPPDPLETAALSDALNIRADAPP